MGKTKSSPGLGSSTSHPCREWLGMGQCLTRLGRTAVGAGRALRAHQDPSPCSGKGSPPALRALALQDGSELLQGAPQGDQGGPSAQPGGCVHSECPAGAVQRARTAQPTPLSAHLPAGASTPAGDLVRESLCR